MLTFSSHAHLQALFESAVLALIPVVLVNGTIPISTTRIGEIPADTSLEETLTSFARELTIMLPTALIMTYYTFDVLRVVIVIRSPVTARVRPGLRAVLRRTASLVAGPRLRWGSRCLLRGSCLQGSRRWRRSDGSLWRLRLRCWRRRRSRSRMWWLNRWWRRWSQSKWSRVRVMIRVGRASVEGWGFEDRLRRRPMVMMVLFAGEVVLSSPRIDCHRHSAMAVGKSITGW